MKLILAPMEGVVDYQMRQSLTAYGGFDLCVTEFVRVVDRLLPAKVFKRYCPELLNGGVTSSGVPVRIQLLGQDPQALADNAAKAVELGSPGVDLNFGCPAKTVNKSKGGAILLNTPDLVHDIVAEVRKTVPQNFPVTAKMRLGFEDKSLALDNAKAIEAAGANELTIHARTKEEGYKPPAHWDWIAKIKQQVSIPIIANGEVWTVEDHALCQQQSGCDNIMLGRGALARPDLAARIKFGTTHDAPWQKIVETLIASSEILKEQQKNQYFANRTKQWLRYLSLGYEEAKELFQLIRRIKCNHEIAQLLIEEGQKAADYS